LWLLPEPLPLEQHERRPWLDGPLAIESGCERIETGWWDGFEVARDYYVAITRRGERLWIYREMHGGRRWFLHGLMGMPY
jgi:protein ImuB